MLCKVTKFLKNMKHQKHYSKVLLSVCYHTVPLLMPNWVIILCVFAVCFCKLSNKSVRAPRSPMPTFCLEDLNTDKVPISNKNEP